MSESKKIAESLQQKMVVGKRYEIKDLIELLPNTNYEFSEDSLTPNNAEPHRPKWNRWVRNTVRNSPDRTDHKTNWWTDLRAEHVGPRDSDWEYWLEGVHDINSDTIKSQLCGEAPPLPPSSEDCILASFICITACSNGPLGTDCKITKTRSVVPKKVGIINKSLLTM